MPNLFATSPIPHSLSCVMCNLVLAFTFALFVFIPKCDDDVLFCFFSTYLYFNAVSAIVTFFFIVLIMKAHLEVDHHDVHRRADGPMLFVSVLTRLRRKKKQEKKK